MRLMSAALVGHAQEYAGAYACFPERARVPSFSSTIPIVATDGGVRAPNPRLMPAFGCRNFKKELLP
jgi:hypothetical protein